MDSGFSIRFFLLCMSIYVIHSFWPFFGIFGFFQSVGAEMGVQKGPIFDQNLNERGPDAPGQNAFTPLQCEKRDFSKSDPFFRRLKGAIFPAGHFGPEIFLDKNRIFSGNKCCKLFRK